MEKFSSLFQKLPKILSNRRSEEDLTDLDVPDGQKIQKEEIVESQEHASDSESEKKARKKKNSDGVGVVLNGGEDDDDDEDNGENAAASSNASSPSGSSASSSSSGSGSSAVLAKREAHLTSSPSSLEIESDPKDDTIRKLETKLQASQSEVEKLQETVKTLEVQIRLTNQKLKVTKSEYKEKDEARKKKLEELQESMHNKDSDDNSKVRKMKEIGDKEVVMLCDAFRNLEVFFDDSYAGFQTRLLDCSQDVVILKDKLQTLVCEKVEYEKQVGELEQIGKDKDEQKRQVIRQLCLQIDYHRKKWLHLLSHQIKPSPNPIE